MLSLPQKTFNVFIFNGKSEQFFKKYQNMSDFWLRVDEELDYLGKNRTFLANKCGFSLTNIGLGIKRGSTPSADTAVKIANELGVSVEYLVTGEEKSESEKTKNNAKLYRKYHELISDCEKLTEKERKAVKSLAKVLCEN